MGDGVTDARFFHFSHNGASGNSLYGINDGGEQSERPIDPFGRASTGYSPIWTSRIANADGNRESWFGIRDSPNPGSLIPRARGDFNLLSKPLKGS